MPTRKELLTAFEKMETERQTLLNRLKQHTEEILSKKPDAASWSVTEVVYHLKVAEGAALAYMTKKLELGGHTKATFSAGLKEALLKLAIALPIKYRAPRVAQLPADTVVTFEEAVREWDTVRNALRKHYETMDESFIGNELFKHPSAGKLNVIQSVRFMRQHVNRHIKQIDRTLKQVV